MTYDDLDGDVIICTRTSLPSTFTDNLVGLCALCHVEVWYRPHVPRPHTLLCVECWHAHAKPGDTMHITRQTALEYIAFKHRN